MEIKNKFRLIWLKDSWICYAVIDAERLIFVGYVSA